MSRNPYLLRKTPRQARSKASFEAILDGAAQVLLADGYDRATTNRIAEVAGVGIGTLYEYFPNKESVYAALKRRLNEQGFTRLMAGAEGGRDLSPRGMLDLIVQARVDVVSGNLALHCALNDQIPHYVTSDQTDNLLDLFLKTAEAFLLDHKAIVNKGDKSIMAEMAMRATYAIVEDTALFAPEKLQDQHYVGELKNLVARYLLRSDSP